MNPATALAVISIIDALFGVMQRVGIGIAEYQSLKARAAQEGRDVTVEDVTELLDQAQSAIDEARE